MNTIDRSRRPRVHDIGALTLAPDTATVLPNGITLHIVNSGTSPVCRISVILPGGRADSPRPQLLEMTASLLTQGTLETPGNRLSDILESHGAWSACGINQQSTILNLYTLCSDYYALLPYVRQMAFTPSFEPEAVDRAKRAEITKLAVGEHRVTTRATYAIRPLIYTPGSNLAAVPTADSVAGFTPEMMREIHGSRLDTSRTHIYIAGLVSPEMAEAAAREFGTIDTGVTFTQTPVEFPTITEPAETVVDMPEALQSCVKMAIQIPGYSSPDYASLRIATCALGGYFGSRLMANIREDKGLTYGIGANLVACPDKAYIIVTTQTDWANTGMVITETVSEIERMKDPATYTPQEVERLSRSLLSSLAAVLDSPFTRADFLISEMLGRASSFNYAVQEQAIRTATADSIASDAARWFDTSRLITSIAGRRI